MRPKEVHCVCPFLKGKPMNRGEFFELSESGHTAEAGLNFQGVDVARLTSFLVQTCKDRHYKVDEHEIEGGTILYLASESIGEKAYYLLTAYIKETDGLTQVMLRAVSDKPHGLNGFLNEIMGSIRHIVSTVQSAWEIGIIKKEQVINIIDSVVQRTTFAGGEGAGEVNIEGSVLQRTKFKGDDGQKRQEEERLRRERVEEERKQREEEERLQNEKARQKIESLQRQKVERERKEREERERREAVEREQKPKKERGKIADEAALKRGRDAAKRASQSPAGQREVKRTGAGKSSHTKFYALALILGALLVGYLLMAPGSDNISGTDYITPSATPSPTPEITATATPTATKTPAVIIASTSLDKTTTNSIGMEFVLIPSGKFEMGSPVGEEGRRDYDGPVHMVTIEKAYYLGKYEVTQEQWRKVMLSNPSRFKGDDLPVEWVSWNDVQEFVRKLNEMEGTDKYRLPSEAEWEYTARAGTTTRYSFGDDESDLSDYAWYSSNSNDKTHPVGQKQPNPWGLYDMHGNVWELVQDSWHYDYNGAPTDGSAWESGDGSARVRRGGSWGNGAWSCLSARRVDSDPDYSFLNLGFRLLQEL